MDSGSVRLAENCGTFSADLPTFREPDKANKEDKFSDRSVSSDSIKFSLPVVVSELD